MEKTKLLLNNRRRLTAVALAIAVVLLVDSIGVALVVNALDTVTVSGIGPYPGAPTYTVYSYVSGSTTYYAAKDAFGNICWSSTNASQILTNASTIANGTTVNIQGVLTCDSKIIIPSNIDGLVYHFEKGATLKKAAGFSATSLIQINIAGGHAYSLNPVENGYCHYFYNLRIDGSKSTSAANSNGVEIIGNSGNAGASIYFYDPEVNQNTGNGFNLTNTNLVAIMNGNVRHNTLNGIQDTNGAANIYFGVNLEANGYGAGAGYAGLKMTNCYDSKIDSCDFGMNNCNGATDTGMQIIEDSLSATNTYVNCKIQSSIQPSNPYSILGNQSSLIGCVGDLGQPINWIESRADRHFDIPTNGGWTTSVTGSGAVTQQPMRMYLTAGVTASSTSLAAADAYFLNNGSLLRQYVDWTKRIELSFSVTRVTNENEAIGRIQLKEAGTSGNLSQIGIGVDIYNYTLIGEAYGSARGAVTLATMSNNLPVNVRIVLMQGAVLFYVNNALSGKLTGTAVPSTEGAAGAYLLASMDNGVSGGATSYLMLGNFQINQAS